MWEWDEIGQVENDPPAAELSEVKREMRSVQGAQPGNHRWGAGRGNREWLT